MKALLLKFIFLISFEVICFSAYAQKKDSLASKSVNSKEDLGITKKRHHTFFVSDRTSEDEKFDIFKITPTPQPLGVIIVRGHLDVLESPQQKKGRINVFNASNGELVGIYNTNSYTGNYILVLVPNVKYIFKIEVSGYGTIKEVVEVPLKIDYEICRQDMKIKLNEKQKPIAIINSFFADENEKVFYMKSTLDTVKTNEDHSGALVDEEINTPKDKNGKPYSTIDEMVKKQVEEEKKKPAEALSAFKNNNFEGALLLYTALLKNDPGDPFMNYYYGVCLLKLDINKAKAINSLQLASNFKDVPYDVFLYLGKAYHLSYLFREAMIALEEYKKRAKPQEVLTNNVTLLIKNCNSGISLLTEQVNISITKRTSILQENILANYNPELTNDKVMYKTDFFNSSVDKKKQVKLLICNSNKREYIHVSYGEKELSGLDLYKNTYGPTKTLGPSQPVIEVNTSYDENYPYLTRDGKTLYFSSKGHNSMGGYDIFKCTRADSVSAWSKPQNLGYPINSTYDDILFIPDTSNQFASYCSNRKNNKFEYIQIKMPQQVSSNSIIKGNFSTLDSIPGRDALITVFNSNTGEIAGVYKTNPLTGQYLMVLVSGLKYDITVESNGYPELNGTFEIPEKKGDFILKQVVKFQKGSSQKSSELLNYFTEEEASKINIEVTVQKKTAADLYKEKSKNEQEFKKHTVAKKPARSPEEMHKDQEDLKHARSLFDQWVYQEAALIYQDLENHIDLEALDSYYYGVSLFHSKKDKSTCVRVLEAASSSKAVPVDVFYYLGKANHMNYRFSAAIRAYQRFKALCKPAEVQKLNIEKEIEYCTNGIKLVNNPVVIEVYDKKHVDLAAIQNSLTQIESGAKILVITDDMRSSIDKKKKFKSLLFLSADKNTVLYSSYGENDANGKDIYQLKKLANGKWTPVPLNITSINSKYDEEYPCLSKDGKTLYFSSKGFENMGGYDIFKSLWDETTQTWSAPVNMGSPINSPFEDMYFLE